MRNDIDEKITKANARLGWAQILMWLGVTFMIIGLLLQILVKLHVFE